MNVPSSCTQLVFRYSDSFNVATALIEYTKEKNNDLWSDFCDQRVGRLVKYAEE